MPHRLEVKLLNTCSWFFCSLIQWHQSNCLKDCVHFRVHSGLCKYKLSLRVLPLKSTFGEVGVIRIQEKTAFPGKQTHLGPFASRTPALTFNLFLQWKASGEDGSTSALPSSGEIHRKAHSDPEPQQSCLLCRSSASIAPLSGNLFLL